MAKFFSTLAALSMLYFSNADIISTDSIDTSCSYLQPIYYDRKKRYPITIQPIYDEPVHILPVCDEPITIQPVQDEPATPLPIDDIPITIQPIYEPCQPIYYPLPMPVEQCSQVITCTGDECTCGVSEPSILPADCSNVQTAECVDSSVSLSVEPTICLGEPISTQLISSTSTSTGN